ncbi:MAG: hypothetical protein ABS35_30490 [Kaistia sp. SCN 65-12]|nr:MAG: hypothetical protein ABS35_30490 [Kaistia sp. SCN 65-12]
MAGEKGQVDRALLDPDGVFPQRLAGDRAFLAASAGDLWTLEAGARESRLRGIATLAHRLGGAAGTFGHHAVSEAALALEDEILDRQPGACLPSWQSRVRQAIDALARALDEALAAG